MTDTRPGRGFAMFPAWLAWKKPSPNAVTVYVHLALFGTFNPGTATYEECRPSKRTLAEGYPDRGYSGTGLGVQTVGRALRELEDLGAIKGEPSFDPETGAQGPTVYRLVFGQVIEGDDDTPDPVSPVTRPPRITRDPGVADDKGAGVTGDTPPVSPVTPNLEVTNQEPLYQDPPPPPPAFPGRPDGVEATPQEEEGGRPSPDSPTPTQVAADVLDTLILDGVATTQRPRGQLRARALAGLTQLLGAGWDPDQLGLAVGGSWDGAASIGAVLESRIRGLLTEPVPAPERVQRHSNGTAEPALPLQQPCSDPECDSRRGGVGMVETQGGVLPCPSCRPEQAYRFTTQGGRR